MSKVDPALNVVLGAGPVGRALVSLLVSEGEPTRVATRSGHAPGLPDEVELVAADIADPEQAARACAGAAIVYGCVGLDYAGWPERWPPMMAGMLAGAEAAGARFVFMDNLYMYGPVDEPMHEEMPLTDYGRKPATRAAITGLWQEAHAAGRVQAVAVRASDFYGPGVTAAMLGERTFGRLVQGKAAQVFGDPDLPHSFAYVPDVARALLRLGRADDADYGQAWHAPHAPDRSVRQLIEGFAEAAGCEPRIQVAPALLLKVFGLLDPNARELEEMLYQWRRPFRVDHGKYAARFGDAPTPFEEGLAATADRYRQQA